MVRKIYPALALVALVASTGALAIWQSFVAKGPGEVLKLSGSIGEFVSQTFKGREDHAYEVRFTRAEISGIPDPFVRVAVYRLGDESPVIVLQARLVRNPLAYGGLEERLELGNALQLPQGTYQIKVKSVNVPDWEVMITDRSNQE